MKFNPKFRVGGGRRRGFTLVEMMFSVFIFCVLFVGALVTLQIFGLRVYTLSGTKLSASGAALKALNQIREDVHGARFVDIGNCSTPSDPSTFHLTGNANKNAGSALRVCLYSNQVSPYAYCYAIYYLQSDSTTNVLKVAYSTENYTNRKIVANYVTNQVVFTAEDCMKNVLYNDSANRIIRMELDFYQWEYPIGYVGGVGANAYSSYTVMTRVTARLID